MTDVNSIDKPKIYLINFTSSLVERLEAQRFTCHRGDIGGHIMKREGDRFEIIKPIMNGADNLHESDIIVIDLSRTNVEYFSEFGNIIDELKLNGITGIRWAGGQYLIDLQPYIMASLRSQFNHFFKKQSIVIIIGLQARDEKYRIEKYMIEYGAWVGCTQNEWEVYRSIDFYSHRLYIEPKSGKIINLVGNCQSAIDLLLKKYKEHMTYKAIFNLPMNGNPFDCQPIEGYTPLANNDIGECVSLVHSFDNSKVYFFPEIDDTEKENFVFDLLTSTLPELDSSLFPYHGQTNWLNDCLLPGELELQNERQMLDEKYKNDIQNITCRAKKIKDDYKFLHDLLTETGEALVYAVKHFFEWLGFESVITSDDHNNGCLEEDLRIENGNKLLLIEVKGIFGTSKDAECSQIQKIVTRRLRDMRDLDSHGLYIYCKPSTQ